MRFPNMGEEQNIEGRFLGLRLRDTSSLRRCLPSIIMYDLQAELTGRESFSLHRLVLGLRHLPKIDHANHCRNINSLDGLSV